MLTTSETPTAPAIENCPNKNLSLIGGSSSCAYPSKNEKKHQQFLALMPKGICAKNKQACRVVDKHTSTGTAR
jgi:hypothetical protein